MTRIALRALHAEFVARGATWHARVAAMALDGCPSALDVCARIIDGRHYAAAVELHRERSATLRADLALRVTL